MFIQFIGMTTSGTQAQLRSWKNSSLSTQGQIYVAEIWLALPRQIDVAIQNSETGQ